jgi:PAS domain S-box-containing protein
VRKLGTANTLSRLRVLAWLSLLLIPAWPAVAKADQTLTPKGILVLYYYGKDYPANVEFEKGIQAALKSSPPGSFEYYPEYLEPNRFPGKLQSAAFQDYLSKKYADQRIDVVIAQTDIALSFLLQHRQDLFPNTPIVFFGRQSPQFSSQPGHQGFSGIVADDAYQQTLDLALTLHPGTKRVYVVTRTPDNDPTLGTIVQEQLRPFESRLEVVYLTNLPLEEMLTQVRNAGPESIILYVRYSQDEPGKTLGPREILALVAQSSKVPIYGIAEGFVGHGIVGGYLFRQDEAGQRLAEMSMRIASGTQVADIPIEKARVVPMFDWRELRRWGIEDSRLPANSVVRFREPTFWELYKWRIVGVISLIILQASLIVVLLVQRVRRRQAERENERFAKLLEAQHRRLDEVVSNVPGVVWETRIDPASGERKTEFVSRYVEKMLGYGADDFVSGQGFGMSLIPAEDRERVKRETNEILASRKPGTVQFRWSTRDGRSLWVEAHLAAVTDENGEPVGLRGVTMDITERVKAESSLRASEGRFRIMADSAPVMIWMAGPDQRCSYLNQGWLSFTGRTIDAEIGTGWTEIVSPHDYVRFLDRYNAAFQARESFQVEFRMRRADGVYRWVYDCGTPRFSADGEFLGYIGSCIDISDRKHAEEALLLAHEEVSKLKNQLEAENIYLKEEIKLAHNVDEIVGDSDAIKYVLFKIEQVGQTDATVLILGETGTGKELVARAIHNQSLRKDRPLVKVNCAALSASLIESELFGHEKGSFTGASARKIGRFELADGGTIFLDEIGELPLELQSKLLRIVQEGEFERLGSTKTLKVNVRILAATNRNLKAEVEKGTFREDLWYRLNVFPITVPPLRQRREDIPQLVEHFVNALSKKVGKNITAISSAASKKLQSYSWPGNVRELANVIERAVINAQGSVLHVADQFEPAHEELSTSTQTLEEVEKEYILRVLDEASWKIEGPNGAAKRLGLNPSTLRTRMTKLGIQKSIRAVAGNPAAST